MELKNRIEKIPKKFHRAIGLKLDAMAGLIRAKRKLQNHTQEQLAESLNISIDTMKSIECGRRFPSLPMLIYICMYLEIELSIG